ncbi:histidine phosphatase family protein [Aminobacter anthyllidis]|uniref:Histidine phosphatase family protein n=1 Tax=Aminobacter anthyllidis TaxID=1035067 RepID=A0A9X1D3U7_9HYPH|nr:histidine phosphatase family protein [Aminobacter anthyllidis]MBT1155462.1 histidine phosphatase family protein [Aminobacter anthyllidis]
MTPLIYFVRHGQTPWNAEQRLQGQADIDIDAVGREQADRNGRRLAGLVVDPDVFDFVASPMRRTRETMERLRVAMGLDPMAYRTDPRLVEVNFGDWQGFTYAELEMHEPGAGDTRLKDKWEFVPPGEGAESYEMLTCRIRPWLVEVTRPTVCVTHGGVLRAISRLVEDLPKNKAAALEIPQDRVLRVENGRLDWL